ncbi:AcrR family transcriptional regulator [Ochrobactrum sp. 19YEA23]|uniref:TetR/AcrR family transcriptional regulator n=1 Tax=Ochrobactrum sp. 19YEA23 TaxID=3039854 RepID=UPI00247A0DCF|nr:AcrR family transcriptional regulator [Ochrobactrum sp. 19YEA23]
MTHQFQRARSTEAKQQRENDILQAARTLAAERGIRAITLTEIANAIGMHKSALLRYFETREQIFLILAGQSWREWSAALRADLDKIPTPDPRTVAGILARSLVTRPLFCDLLAHVPLNLERNVSVENVRTFKLVALEEVAVIAAKLQNQFDLSQSQAVNIISTAVSMAGALWQMATPGPDVAQLYREEPLLAHAIVDVEPRLRDILYGLISGYISPESQRGSDR